MHYESIAAHFLLVSTVLLWSGVLGAKGPAPPDDQNDQETSSKIEPASKMPSPWTVRFNTSDREEVANVLTVLSTFNHLFEHLEHVGMIESDEVLAYYPLLSEMSFVKKNYPKEFQDMLINWPLPKGNYGLSLLVSIGQIGHRMLGFLVSYLTHISDKPARVAAVNYYLDVCASDLQYLCDNSYRILRSAFAPSVVSRLKRNLYPSLDTSILIASSLLHFAPDDLGDALVKALNDALVEIEESKSSDARYNFCKEFALHPTTLHDRVSTHAIYVRNLQKFETIPFTEDQRAALNVLNRIKFGLAPYITNMKMPGRKAFFDMFRNRTYFTLIFHIWAREDVPADVWVPFANDRSNTSTLSRLALDLEGFFLNHFDVGLFKDNLFHRFLKEFKYCPNSTKKERFQTLLRAKVEEHSETRLALLQNLEDFTCLLHFFIDQDDKVGLKALLDLVFVNIDGAPLTDLAQIRWDIVRACQLVDGGVDGPLGHLAERFGAAAVLRRLDFSLLRAIDVQGLPGILRISVAQMILAISSLSHDTEPEDELAAVLWGFHNHDRDRDQDSGPYALPKYHALWFYLWKTHREAFITHVHPNIQRHYLPAELSV